MKIKINCLIITRKKKSKYNIFCLLKSRTNQLIDYYSFNQFFLFLPLPDNVSNVLLKPFTFEGVGIVGLLFPGRGGGGKFCYNI